MEPLGLETRLFKSAKLKEMGWLEDLIPELRQKAWRHANSAYTLFSLHTDRDPHQPPIPASAAFFPASRISATQANMDPQGLSCSIFRLISTRPPESQLQSVQSFLWRFAALSQHSSSSMMTAAGCHSCRLSSATEQKRKSSKGANPKSFTAP